MQELIDRLKKQETTEKIIADAKEKGHFFGGFDFKLKKELTADSGDAIILDEEEVEKRVKKFPDDWFSSTEPFNKDGNIWEILDMASGEWKLICWFNPLSFSSEISCNRLPAFQSKTSIRDGPPR